MIKSLVENTNYLQKVNQKIKSNFPFVYKKIRKIYKSTKNVYKLFPHLTLQRAIVQTLQNKPNIFFIQVGSNDGLHGDPIQKLIINNKHWRGIFIEPVKFLFNRLKSNYQEKQRFIFENVAIGEEQGETKFFYVAEEAKIILPGNIWYDQLGSFSKDHILKHFNNINIEPYVVEEKVPCFTLMDILQKHFVKEIDLLHIDTEGFDYKVLSQLNFNYYKPSVILYEHLHLSKEERKKAQNLLISEGYKLIILEWDTLALNRK